HESGHALVAKLLPGTDPIHKVSIIPRGMALGVTQQLPVDERHNYSREFLENNLAVLLGGRVAEELIFDQMTTGAGNDIERATNLARKMVCQWGMSDALGPLSLADKDDSVFLGRELIAHKTYSEETARLIDAEVKRIIEEALAKAKGILETNEKVLRAIAAALLERETITGEEIDKIMKDEGLSPMNPPKPDPEAADKNTDLEDFTLEADAHAGSDEPAADAPADADADAEAATDDQDKTGD
ncbi:MAG: hypothetical protein SVS15_09160, partial [Thermodesulfobacteriota bacterium]|nr:hypothetical protein [Thermodesulfobacteriota bacterium]